MMSALPLDLAWSVEFTYRGVKPPRLTVCGDRIVFSCQRLGAIDGSTGALEWIYPLEVVSHVLCGRTVWAWVADQEAHLIDVETGVPTASISSLSPTSDVMAVDGSVLIYRDRDDYGRWTLTCYDAMGERPRWQHGGPRSWWHRQHVGAGAGIVLLGLADGTLRALSLESGKELWERRWPAEETADGPRPVTMSHAPVFHGNHAIVPVDRRRMALDVGDGATVWETDALVGEAHLHGDRLYGIDHRGYRVVDATNGALGLTKDVRSELATLFGSQQINGIQLVWDGHVFVSVLGGVAALVAGSGDIAWHTRFNGVGTVLAASRDRLFAATDGQRLLCYSTAASDAAGKGPPTAPAPTDVPARHQEEPAPPPKPSPGRRVVRRRLQPRKGVDLMRLDAVELARLTLERQLWSEQAGSLLALSGRFEVAFEAIEEMQRRENDARPGWQWLLDLLGDTSQPTPERSAAIALLRESPLREQATPAILAALGHADAEMRRAAVASLRFLGASARSALPQLRKMADLDPEETLRGRARRALAKLGGMEEEGSPE